MQQATQMALPHQPISQILLFLLFLLVLSFLPPSFSDPQNPKFLDCAPTPYTCAGIEFDASYPFRVGNRPDYCGYEGFLLKCSEDNSTLETYINSKTYQVKNIDFINSVLTIVDIGLVSSDSCLQSFSNTTMDFSRFAYTDRDRNVTIYFNCTASFPGTPSLYPITCLSGTTSYYRLDNSFLPDLFGKCSSVALIPLNQSFADALASGNGNLFDALQWGFTVRWTVGGDWCSSCMSSGGLCGYNSSFPDDHTCFCANSTTLDSCSAPRDGKSSGKKGLIIGLVAGICAFILACILCFALYVRKRRQLRSITATPLFNSRSYEPSFEKDPEFGSMDYQTHIFSYKELHEATDGFDASKELGDGGFGAVYKGKLQDGRIVAVKRLYETSYKRVEQFMNEVEILSRIRHQNLVTLYGCTSPQSRNHLLVYEFVSNGTVADHLHGSLVSSEALPWAIRLKIAIETADALAYLHATEPQIIHRDVKTNNILLDNSFNVKVADFGLSRLFPVDATHVSTAPQGTPGYLDPEYHQCYQLTDKSDVYSFGVVLVELISSKPAVDVSRQRNEIVLATMAINKIQSCELEQLVDPALGFESDCDLRRMITLVGELAFRCLQGERDMRPTMKEVLEVLRGIESGEYKVEKAEEGDETGLLKKMAPLSPDSVTNKWVSWSTTPNTSG